MDAHDAPIPTIFNATVVTEDDLIAALMAVDASDANPHGALTMGELVAATGIGSTTLRHRLRVLHDAGRLGVTRVAHLALDGRTLPLPAYYVRR